MKRTVFLKLFCVCLCLSMTATALFGCGKNGDIDDEPQTTVRSSPEVQTVPLKLPYSQTDTLDPFHAKSAINIQLTTLLYDGLFSLNESLEAEPQIAASYTVAGASVSVALRSGVAFSNGAAVRPDDVVYSFNKAKKSNAYSARLENITSASSMGNGVVFAMSKENLFVPACLDFAIVQSGTVDDFSGKDKDLAGLSVPVGSGRYIADTSGASAVLRANPMHIDGEPAIKTIALVDIPDTASLSHSVEIGNTDFVFRDLASGDVSRINTATADVVMNNLVFISFNPEKAPLLALAGVRRAISILVDRAVVCEQAFQTHAAPAVTPFNPSWWQLKGVTPETDKVAQPEAAIELLKVLGFAQTRNGVRYSNEGELVFTLAVCEENGFKLLAAELISQQLAKAGMAVSLAKLSWEDYEKAVKNGDYDMYLGEIKLCSDMGLDSFFYSGGEASDGIDITGGAASAYLAFRGGTSNCAAFVAEFTKDMPFVPVCFRSGIAAFSRSIKSGIICTANDVYYNTELWKF